MSYKKSNVTSRTWSTPFNTPFFIRWGEWNIKVPMETLREEYDAWEEIQQGSDSESPSPAPSPPFPPGSFDWAENVEQELFSSASDLTSQPDADHVDPPPVGQVVPEVVTEGRVGTTPYTVSEADGEEGVTREDKAGEPKSTMPAAPTNVDNTIYRIVNISTTSNDLSVHMVEDAGADTGHSTTTQKLSEAIEFLAGIGFLHLDNYATVFEAVAARACASGNPFWLRDPRCGYEVVV